MLLKQLPTLASSVHSLNQCQMPFHDVGTTIAGIMKPGNASRKEIVKVFTSPYLK